MTYNWRWAQIVNHLPGIEYSSDSLNHANSVLNKFNTFVSDCNAVVNGLKKIQLRPGVESQLWEKLILVKEKTDSVLIDNFDTPSAVKLINEAMSEFNRNVEVRIFYGRK